MLPSAHQLRYAEVMTRKPNPRFKDTFAHFYTEFDQKGGVEVETNKEDMKKAWHPSKWFQVPKQRIQDGCTYAAFISKQISNKDALNMLTVVITRTSLFAREYKDWHAQPPSQKTINAAFAWWAEKVRIMKKYNRAAGSMCRGKEYGINADNNENGGNVFEYYALSMQILNHNTQLQQQIQQQQMAIAQLQQQCMLAGNANLNNNQSNSKNNNNQLNNNNGNQRKK